MKEGPDELRGDLDNPFFRAPDSRFYVPKPFPRGASKRDLLRRLKASLAEMQVLCHDKDATLGSGETYWPSEGWLKELSENIWRLSLSHKRGAKDLWSCVKAIDNRYPAQRLSAKIEKLVTRAAKLYKEPAAIAIQRQAMAANQAAIECFAALKRCHDGRSHIGSENWAKYAEILRPSSKTCEAKAADLVIEWLLDDLSPEKPWDCLASWVSTVGNPTLASKLLRPDCAKQPKSNLSSLLRQRRYRQRQNDPIRRSLLRILDP